MENIVTFFMNKKFPPRRHIPYVFYWAPLAALFTLSLVTPKDVMDQWSMARTFTDFMAAFIPQIDHVGAVSRDAAQANRFVSAVSWAVSPWYVGVTWVDMQCNSIKEPYRSVGAAVFSELVVLIFSCVSFFIFPTQTRPDNRVAIGMFISDFGRAVWVPSFALFTPVMFVSVVILLLQQLGITKGREANHGE